MKTVTKAPPRATAGGATTTLLLVIAIVAIIGLVAMRNAGFPFAPDAAKMFLDKLPVLFLVALLIERTGEIFLTIARGAKSESMEAGLDTLAALKKSKSSRDDRLGELTKKINDCNARIAAFTSQPGSESSVRTQQELKAAMESELDALNKTATIEDPEIASMESTALENGTAGTLQSRTTELMNYKHQTRNKAMILNFVLALFISGCGFRAVEGLVTPPSTAPEGQINFFRFFDILLTAGLLAGGANPINRIMKLLRDFMDVSNKNMKARRTAS